MDTTLNNQEYYENGIGSTKRRSSGWIITLLGFLVLGSLIGWLWYRVDTLEKQLIGITTEISSIESELSYTTTIAKNADMYAHSHGYSDVKLKTNIRVLGKTKDDLLSLQAIRYSWRDSAQAELGLGSETEIGLLAQDVEKVYPELVWVDKDGYKHVDYARLSVVLIEAIREQQAQIDRLENQILELELNR